MNPLGEPSHFFFEFGLDTKYGTKTPLAWAGQQIAPRLVFAELTGLKPGTIYHYRLGAVNKVGTTLGPDATFETAK